LHSLEIWVRGHARSLKIAPINRSYTTSYQSAMVSIDLEPFLSYWTLKNTVTWRNLG